MVETAPARSAPSRTAGRAWPWFLILDLALVTVFAALGRQSHEHGLTPAGVLATALPFLVACLLGWAAARAWRSPAGLWPTGVVLWLVTAGAGLGIRALTGGGTATSFMVVTFLVLGAFLLGSRLAWRAVRRLRSRRIR